MQQRDGDEAGVSIADLRDWKTSTKSFTTIAGVVQGSLTVLDGAGEPERYAGARVAWDMFRLLGVRPILGRDFLESDDQPNAAGVALISHMLWTTRYESDPQIIGRSVDINGTAHTIIGVMPPTFAFPESQRLWIALQPQLFKDPRNARYVFTFGRLRPGVSAEQALSDLNTVAAGLEKDYPATNTGWRARTRTLREAFLPDDVRLILGLMMASVTLVLFIACSNVANLLLARATARRHELAMRVALGAGRARIVLQLLTEGVVLAMASVPLGVLLAVAGTRLIQSQIPPGTVPDYVTWQVDGRSLAWAVIVAAVTALVFGLVPAVQISRRELQENLKEGARGTTGRGAIVRNGLVVSQVSLALVALVGALLFVRSFSNLDGFRLGFDTSSALTMRFFMGGDRYAPIGVKARRVEDIVRRVEGLPGVQAVFASNLVPVSGGGASTDVEIEGRGAENQHPTIQFPAVTPQVLRTLDVRVRQGRDFAESDSTRSVAIINETMARRMWPNESPIDRRFRIWTEKNSREWITVVGVAPDMHLWGVDPSNSQIPPLAFVPFSYGEFSNTGLTIRVSGDPTALVTAVRAAIRASDPKPPCVRRADARRGAAAGILGVRPVWLDLRHDWRHRRRPRVDRRLWRPGLLGLAANAGDRRARHARRRPLRCLQADRRAGTQAHRDRHRHRSCAGGVRHAADAQPALQREPVRSRQFHRRLAVFHRRGPGGQLRAGSTCRQRRPRRCIAPELTQAGLKTRLYGPPLRTAFSVLISGSL